MRELNDYYTIAIDQLYETETESKIIKLNEAYIDPEEGNKYIHKRLFGKIISGPLGFSNEVVDAISPGYDEPRAFVGGDKIQEQVNLGDRTWSRKSYNCGTWAGFEVNTLKDYAKLMDVKSNDKVYFTETVTEPENFLGMSNDGKQLYRCRADNVICAVRGHKIKMQGTWVLIEASMQSWDEITTPHGIIMQPKPGIKYLRGIVKHIENDSLKKGDEIFYLPDSNWGLTIEGVEYFGIRKKEVIVTLKKKNPLAH